MGEGSPWGGAYRLGGKNRALGDTHTRGHWIVVLENLLLFVCPAKPETHLSHALSGQCAIRISALVLVSLCGQLCEDSEMSSHCFNCPANVGVSLLNCPHQVAITNTHTHTHTHTQREITQVIL